MELLRTRRNTSLNYNNDSNVDISWSLVGQVIDWSDSEGVQVLLHIKDMNESIIK